MGENFPFCLLLKGFRMDFMKEFDQKRREEFKEKNVLSRSIKRGKCREMIHLC